MAASLGTRPSVSSLVFSSFYSNRLSFSNCSPSTKLQYHISSPTLSFSFSSSPLPLISNQRLNFEIYSALQEEVEVIEESKVNEVEETEVKVEVETEDGSSDEKKRKLFVVNLPWGFAVNDIKTLFGECGTVKDVEIIKAKDGRHKGFAFITMDSAEEAKAVVDKFDSHEVSGRIIRVEFAKRLRKPSPPPPVGTPVVETRHKLYVSNLQWKARASHLREFFAAEFNPVSARVVFDRPSGGSAGYGFVSFATKEEAESAISSLDGKELMGRPIRLKFSEKSADGSGSELEDGSVPEGQSKEAEGSVSQPEES